MRKQILSILLIISTIQTNTMDILSTLLTVSTPQTNDRGAISALKANVINNVTTACNSSSANYATACCIGIAIAQIPGVAAPYCVNAGIYSSVTHATANLSYCAILTLGLNTQYIEAENSKLAKGLRDRLPSKLHQQILTKPADYSCANCILAGCAKTVETSTNCCLCLTASDNALARIKNNRLKDLYYKNANYHFCYTK